MTIAFVIFIVACDPQHLSIEEIEYEPSTEQVIKKYTDVYNFEKIELVYVRNSQTQSYELVIKGTMVIYLHPMKVVIHCKSQCARRYFLL